MEYCSMSSMYYSQPNTTERISVCDSLKKHAELGIKNIDLNMCAVGRFGEHEFDNPDWEDRAYKVRDTAKELGLNIVQTHLPYMSALHKYDFYSKESRAMMSDCTLRAMKISNIVGAKWAVVHPAHNMDASSDNVEKQKAWNFEFYGPILEEAHKGCCGIAVENMNDKAVRPNSRTYCVQVDQLIDLVDSFNDPKVQITWDFGHGNLGYGDKQDWAIRQIGSRLKAVHVADNFGQIDDHLAPYQGMINWDSIMHALADIEFDGYWDFEIGKTYSNLPMELRDDAMRFYGKIAQYMVERYEKIKRGEL